jgi:hypothetical protein
MAFIKLLTRLEADTSAAVALILRSYAVHFNGDIWVISSGDQWNGRQ